MQNKIKTCKTDFELFLKWAKYHILITVSALRNIIPDALFASNSYDLYITVQC